MGAPTTTQKIVIHIPEEDEVTWFPALAHLAQRFWDEYKTRKPGYAGYGLYSVKDKQGNPRYVTITRTKIGSLRVQLVSQDKHVWRRDTSKIHYEEKGET